MHYEWGLLLGSFEWKEMPLHAEPKGLGVTVERGEPGIAGSTLQPGDRRLRGLHLGSDSRLGLSVLLTHFAKFPEQDSPTRGSFHQLREIGVPSGSFRNQLLKSIGLMVHLPTPFS
ncbi:MAG TPA: hypothetical protein VFX35_07035 [Solirubrobacterales bacterium]|nr:hypothetical protein [Solirubrobacterales bacterium]